MSFFGYPKGHRVESETLVFEQHGGLTFPVDTLPRTKRLKDPTATTKDDPQDGTDSLSETLKLLVSNIGRRNLLLSSRQSTTGRTAASATTSASRAVGRGQEARRVEIVTGDPIDRPDPGGSHHCDPPDTTPFSCQATAMDLPRFWDRDTQQCRVPFCQWKPATLEEADIDSGVEPQSQSRSEESVQERGDHSCG